MTRKYVNIARENEIYILFDFDNYNALGHNTFKKIKAVDNIELNTGNNIQKLKILLSDGSLKSSIYLVNT